MPDQDFCPSTAGVGVTCNGVFYGGQGVSPFDTMASVGGVTCNGVFYSGQSYCPTSYTTAPVITTSLAAGGAQVTFTPGCRLLTGPTGTIVTGSSGPLYAFGPGSTTYSILPPGSPLQAGVGYWAYFTAPTPASLAFATSGESTATLPPGQFVMIGNPDDTVATVTGADALFTWNGSQYTPVTQLSPVRARGRSRTAARRRRS